MCRNSETRKLIAPSTLMLDPRGVFVIRPPEGVESNIYVWQGILIYIINIDYM
jgi:hypothetical protein